MDVFEITFAFNYIERDTHIHIGLHFPNSDECVAYYHILSN